MTTLVHRYAPRSSCRAIFSDRRPAILLSGPAGTGKTRACLEKLHLMMLQNPGARGLIVRKTAESLTSTALVTWREWVAKETIEAGVVDFYGGSAEHAPQYRYNNGSAILLGGMDRPTKIMSSEYDVIYVQEAIELSVTDWEALETRLRNGRISFQQIIADTNPDRPTHWLYQRANSGAVVMRESRHTDNPRIYDDRAPEHDPYRAPDGTGADGLPYWLSEYGAAYMARLDVLTGTRRARLRDGKWVAAEGLVYEEYDPAVHLVDAFPVPEDWPRRWSIDFGFRHPFVCSMWARDPDGVLVRYREHFGTGRTVDDWARAILDSVRVHEDKDWPEPDPNAPDSGYAGRGELTTDERGRVREVSIRAARTACSAEDHWRDHSAAHHYRWTEPQPEVIICDHDAEGRVVLERLLGLSTRAAMKRVNEGIDAVKQRFKENRIRFMRGVLVEPDQELRDAHKPTCTEEEIPGYRWNEQKEAPVKTEDDGCDTARYVVAYEDLVGRSNVRF